MDESNQIELIEYILKSPKFLALFRGSLETEKYTFLVNMRDLLDDEDLFLVCDEHNLKVKKALLKESADVMVRKYFKEVRDDKFPKRFLSRRESIDS